MAAGAGERTEQATSKRKEQARGRGQVARSAEVTSALLLIVGMSVLIGGSGHLAEVLGRNARFLFSQAHVLGPANRIGVEALLKANIEVILAALAPLLAAVLIAGVGGNVIQVGFRVTPKALEFKTSKLNPFTGMKKFFQPNAFFELIKNVFKIAVIGLLAWMVISSLMGRLNATPLLPLPAVVAEGKAGFVQLMAVLLFFMVILGAADWFWQQHRHEKNIRMTKYEVKKEMKDVEGDPQIKARVRGLQFEMARKRMLADVPTADVVVTNPTHFAVALKYQPGSPAPVVVAKGQDHVAQVIKRVAKEFRVPVIENKPLARSLHREVDVGDVVPEGLFQAVAEVLAYVYRLKKA
jgi:flagellar biosynthetic protein FlhB